MMMLACFTGSRPGTASKVPAWITIHPVCSAFSVSPNDCRTVAILLMTIAISSKYLDSRMFTLTFASPIQVIFLHLPRCRIICAKLLIVKYCLRFLAFSLWSRRPMDNHRMQVRLRVKAPAALETILPRSYKGLGDLKYPAHDLTAIVTRCGRIGYKHRRVRFNTVFAGQRVGVKRARKWVFLEDIIRADLSPTKENRQRAKYVSSKLPSDRLDDLLASPRGGRPSYMNNALTKGRP